MSLERPLAANPALVVAFEDDAEEGAVRLEVPEERCGEAREQGGEGLALLLDERVVEARDQLDPAGRQHRVEERVPIFEVVVDRAHRDAGGRGDVLHPRPQALGGEDLLGGGDDGPGRLDAEALPQGGGGGLL